MDKVINIATSIGLFIAGISIAFMTCKSEITKYLEKQKTKVSDNLPKQSAIDIRLTERMENAKELLNADVIHIYEFHNGEHYADGRSALKFSCTYEITRYDIDSIRSSCSQVPIACMPKYIHTLLYEKEFKCSDIEDLKEKFPATYAFKKSLNIKCFNDFVIKNSKNQVVGFVSVMWDDVEKYSKDLRELEKLAYYIEESLIDIMKQ